MEKRIVDAKGMACPLPVVNAKKAAETMKSGDILTVLVDNEIAVQNLTRFGENKGYQVKSEKKAENEFEVVMTIGQTTTKENLDNEETAMEDNANIVENMNAEEEILCTPDSRKKGMVVVLSANVMGTGDENLGKALMKAFVFALTKQDYLPETILCYNSGAYLTCEDADTLEDLKALEAAGVEIFTCGTCLDFYGIKDKLAVGNVTNMYDIVEKMERAKQVVRP